MVGLRDIFAKQRHIRRIKFDSGIKARGQVVEHGQRVKTDVRGVPDVMPLGKRVDMVRQPGHHAQPAHRFQHGEQPLELGVGIAQMLRHFSGADEIVLFFKHRRMVLIKRVVQIHGVSLFLQHPRQGRAGAAPKVQAGLAGGQPFEQRLAESGEEAAIPGVMGIVLMQIILGPLLVQGQPMALGDKDQLAMPATQVVSVFILKKWPGMAFAAQGATGGVAFGFQKILPDLARVFYVGFYSGFYVVFFSGSFFKRGRLAMSFPHLAWHISVCMVSDG